MIGENIRKIRRAKDLTQDELAKKAGTQASAISHYEKERRTPGIHCLMSIAAALSCSVNDLIKDEPF